MVGEVINSVLTYASALSKIQKALLDESINNSFSLIFLIVVFQIILLQLNIFLFGRPQREKLGKNNPVEWWKIH